MDFFESVFGWNLDSGSGSAEWLVLTAVLCVLAYVTGRIRLRAGRGRADLIRLVAGHRVTWRRPRYILGREG